MRLSRVLSAAVIGGLFVAVVPIQAFAAGAAAPATLVPARPQIYAPVTLTADLSGLTAKERQMLGLFIDAAVVMDDLFWTQAYPGDRKALLAGLQDPDVRRFAEMNYGPWDRLADNAPFVPGVGAKPLGAQFYPHDMTKEEFERANLPDGRSEYTVVRRDAKGALRTVPYHVEYSPDVQKAADLLEQAATLAEDAAA